jgi:hypothetical protein
MAQVPLLLGRSPSLPSLPAVCLCTASIWLGLAPAASARVNLPQPAQSIPISEHVRQDLTASLANAGAGPTQALPAGVEQLLIDLLPEEFRAACTEMIMHWGTVAEGTAGWSARALYQLREPGSLTLLVAFRCGSSWPYYAQY